MENNLKPVAGMPCTYKCGSDRYPYVIERVSPSGKTVYARRVDRPWVEEKKFMLRDGKFLEKGGDISFRLILGVQESYLDPHR